MVPWKTTFLYEQGTPHPLRCVRRVRATDEPIHRFGIPTSPLESGLGHVRTQAWCWLGRPAELMSHLKRRSQTGSCPITLWRNGYDKHAKREEWINKPSLSRLAMIGSKIFEHQKLPLHMLCQLRSRQRPSKTYANLSPWGFGITHPHVNHWSTGNGPIWLNMEVLDWRKNAAPPVFCL